ALISWRSPVCVGRSPPRAYSTRAVTVGGLSLSIRASNSCSGMSAILLARHRSALDMRNRLAIWRDDRWPGTGPLDFALIVSASSLLREEEDKGCGGPRPNDSGRDDGQLLA